MTSPLRTWLDRHPSAYWIGAAAATLGLGAAEMLLLAPPLPSSQPGDLLVVKIDPLENTAWDWTYLSSLPLR